MASIKQKDIAEYAGVSPATVSRVLNNTAGVKEDLILKVHEAMRELGFNPNTKPVREDTNLLAVIGWQGFLTDIYYSAIYNGILKYANSHNFGLVITDWSDENSDYRQRILTDGSTQGLISIIPSTEEEEIIANAARELNIPFCLVDRYASLPDSSYVTIAHGRTTQIATEHLIQLGHKRIAHITTDVDTQIGRLRIDGYKAAIRGAGLSYRREYLQKAMPTTEQWYIEDHGRWGLERLLELREQPTAVVCVNDRVAFGVLELLDERGIRVPEDMAVVGVDDNPSAKMAYGGLSTVNSQKQRVGSMAAHMVTESIEAGDPARFKVELEPKLIVRKTCGG